MSSRQKLQTNFSIRDIRHGKAGWKLIIFFAISAGIVFCFVSLPSLVGPGPDDPNWAKTHLTVTSVHEAVRSFGSDLLLDKLMLTPVSTAKPSVKFILEHDSVGREELKDRRHWSNLTARVDYIGKPFDADHDYINLSIFFRKKDSAPADEDFHKLGQKSSLETRTVHGTPVIYQELLEHTAEDQYYYQCANFQYHGYPYCVTGAAYKNRNIVWDTVSQMLNP